MGNPRLRSSDVSSLAEDLVTGAAYAQGLAQIMERFERTPMIEQKTGRRKWSRSRTTNPALSKQEAAKIRKQHKEGYTYRELASMYKVSRFTIEQAIKRRGAYA